MMFVAIKKQKAEGCYFRPFVNVHYENQIYSRKYTARRLLRR